MVIGVHTPEFDFEKQLPNVQKAVQKFAIPYPVALDSNHAIWDAFHNEYWPAHYFIDATGKVRYEHFGEGEYDQSERWIQQLLKEAHATPMPASAVVVHGQGVQARRRRRQRPLSRDLYWLCARRQLCLAGEDPSATPTSSIQSHLIFG